MPVLKGEDLLSSQVKAAVKQSQIDGTYSGIAYHCPNEILAKGNQIAALKKRKAIGVMNGAPDWVFEVGDRCATVELKDAKSDDEAWRKCTNAQKEYALHKWATGGNHLVAWNLPMIGEFLIECRFLLDSPQYQPAFQGGVAALEHHE